MLMKNVYLQDNDVYEMSFFPDVVKNWNSLPLEIMNETNENLFLKGIRELEK